MARVWLLQLIVASFDIVFAAPLAPFNSGPAAQIKNGSYYGLHNDYFNQDYFLGVPFAQPPIGDLRLQVPQSLNTSWEGSKNATEYGFACIGYGEDTQIGGGNYVSEDCLTLNIVRPSGYEDQNLPIGVWIYGGGWFEGTSLDPRYNLSFIVDQSVAIEKPIIGVSINYRLSGWGWLYSEEIVKAGLANLGLRDLYLGLRWLQENIDAFGGDPTRVTIWGESAGAVNVGTLLLAYNGRDDGLISGAISESGPPPGVGIINPTTSVAEEVYANVTEAVGCANSTDRISCLRSVPTDTLNNVLNTSSLTEDYYYIYFGPLVDGDIVARNSIDQLQDGSFLKVPYIIGDNSDEGTDFIPFELNTDDDVLNFFAGFDFDNATLNDLLRLYPDDPSVNVPVSSPDNFNSTIGLQFKRAATIISDLIFKAPRRLAARAWLNNTDSSSAPLFSYRFNTIPNGIPDYFAVTHFQEVSFVFHNVEGQGFPDEEPPYFGADPFAGKPHGYFDLADRMSRSWASFIHDGNPNYDSLTGPAWPAYSLSNATNIVFDANVSTYLEPDTYRQAGIDYIVNKYLSREEPWVSREQT